MSISFAIIIILYVAHLLIRFVALIRAFPAYKMSTRATGEDQP